MKYTDINTKKDFLNKMDVSASYLNFLLYNNKKGVENLYTNFKIPKKSGGVRSIDAPNRELKIVQKKLLSLLEKRYNEVNVNNGYIDKISHGYKKNKGIITNAKVHRNKKYLLNIDIKDFFESIHFGRVKGFFEKNKDFKVPPEVAIIISQILCYKGSLPQGAPTSPFISNLIGNIIDIRLLKICKKHKLNYTRYVDDLTFSTNDINLIRNINEILDEIENVINKSGFDINKKKTRLQIFNLRQEVTGITVNRKLNVDKKFVKVTRAMAYNLYTKGEFSIEGMPGNMNQLEGRFAFINQLDKYNNKLTKKKHLQKNSIEHQKHLDSLYSFQKQNSNKHFYRNLNGRETEYQKFLFFKNFFWNDKPIIITEGKTDIKYIKAALKNLYEEFPNLVSKENGEYIYHISFLNRFARNNNKMTKFHYFLNIVQDGADAIKSLYDYYNEKNLNVPNYYDYFSKLSNNSGKSPVILLFDNEMEKERELKPLRKIINYMNLSKDKEEALKVNNYIYIKGNLYLLTHQLMNGRNNELEDLFNRTTLDTIISGKTFERGKKFDKSKNYSKEIFSNYVLENYNTIDFSNFRPLLNNINTIVEQYSQSKK